MKDRIASNIFSGSYCSGITDEMGICYANAQQQEELGLSFSQCYDDGVMKDLVIINMEEGTRYKLQSTQGSNNTLVFKYDGQEFNPRNVYFVDNSVNIATQDKTLSVIAEATQSITLYTALDHTTTITIRTLLADGSQGSVDYTTLKILGSSDYTKQVVWITDSDGSEVNVSIEWISTSHIMQDIITQHVLRLNETLQLQDGQVQN